MHVEAIPYAFCGVVRGGKGLHIHCSYGEGVPCPVRAQQLPGIWILGQQRLGCPLAGINRHIMPLDKGCETLDMVNMLVGQQNRIQHVDRQADPPQCCCQPPDRNTQINQNAGISVYQ